MTRTKVTERVTAVVAATTTWPEFAGLWKPLLDQVYICLGSQGALQEGRNVMLYKDDVPNVEVGVELVVPCEFIEPVIRSVLPAGEVATTVHRGPYEQLRTTHAAVVRACDENDWRRAGPRWEIYRDWQEDPAELETEVYYLLD
ncbi:MAG TPA: GyrI-like domain-containing protein [Pseudonocardiaceae bacterium]|nr:GyrI-like domain-containing protein [Pseudonocardiaceae bacterium]